VRNLELLLGVCALAVIIVGSIARRDSVSRSLSVRLQLGIGVVVGLAASVVVLVEHVDLVPDVVERSIALASVGVAGVVWAVASWLRRRAALSRARSRRPAAGSRSSASPNGPLIGPDR